MLLVDRHALTVHSELFLSGKVSICMYFLLEEVHSIGFHKSTGLVDWSPRDPGLDSMGHRKMKDQKAFGYGHCFVILKAISHLLSH